MGVEKLVRRVTWLEREGRRLAGMGPEVAMVEEGMGRRYEYAGNEHEHEHEEHHDEDEKEKWEGSASHSGSASPQL